MQFFSTHVTDRILPLFVDADGIITQSNSSFFPVAPYEQQLLVTNLPLLATFAPKKNIYHFEPT